MDWVIDESSGKTASIFSKDQMALQRLKEAGEKAKIELSTLLENRDQSAVHHRGRKAGPKQPRREV